MRKLISILALLALVTQVCAAQAIGRRIAAPRVAASGEDPSATSLTNNLVAYWKLDEASGTRSDVAGGNDLTDNNTVTQSAGKISNAGQFTAANSEYLSRADNAALSTATSFTVRLWIYADAFGTNPYIINKSDGGSAAGEYGLFYFTSGSRFRFFIQNGASSTGVDANNLGAPSTATWYHVVCIYDSSVPEIRIIVNNGTADTASVAISPPDTSQAFELGAKTAPTARYWDGRIDEVAFSKKVWSAAEITYDYNAGSGRTYNPATQKFE